MFNGARLHLTPAAQGSVAGPVAARLLGRDMAARSGSYMQCRGAFAVQNGHIIHSRWLLPAVFFRGLLGLLFCVMHGSCPAERRTCMLGPLNGRGNAQGGRGRAGEREAAACKEGAASDKGLEDAPLAKQVRQGGRRLSGRRSE